MPERVRQKGNRPVAARQTLAHNSRAHNGGKQKCSTHAFRHKPPAQIRLAATRRTTAGRFRRSNERAHKLTFHLRCHRIHVNTLTA